MYIICRYIDKVCNAALLNVQFTFKRTHTTIRFFGFVFHSCGDIGKKIYVPSLLLLHLPVPSSCAIFDYFHSFLFFTISLAISIIHLNVCFISILCFCQTLSLIDELYANLTIFGFADFYSCYLIALMKNKQRVLFLHYIRTVVENL